LGEIMSMLKELLGSLFKKPYTIKYPFSKEEVPLPKGFRGKLTVDYNKCIGCGMCARICPAEAIEMVPHGEKKRKPKFYLSRCTYCLFCADVCPVKAISPSDEYEMADYDKYSSDLVLEPPPVEEAPAEQVKEGEKK